MRLSKKLKKYENVKTSRINRTLFSIQNNIFLGIRHINITTMYLHRLHLSPTDYTYYTYDTDQPSSLIDFEK